MKFSYSHFVVFYFFAAVVLYFLLGTTASGPIAPSIHGVSGVYSWELFLRIWCSSLIGIILATLLWAAVELNNSGKLRGFLLIFVPVTVWLMFCSLSLWPGVTNPDGLFLKIQATQLKFHIWYSVFYSLFFASFLKFGIGPFALPIFQTICLALLVSTVLYKINQNVSRKWMIIPAVLALLANPVLLHLCVFISRNSLIAIFSGCIVLLGYQGVKSDWRPWQFLLFIQVSCWMVFIRIDALFLPVSLLIFLFFNNKTFALQLRMTFCALAILISIAFVNPYLQRTLSFDLESYRASYRLVPAMWYIGTIINKYPNIELAEKEIELIEKIAPLDRIRSEWDFRHGFWDLLEYQQQVEEELAVDFAKLAFRLALENPVFTLHYRTRMLAGALGMSSDTIPPTYLFEEKFSEINLIGWGFRPIEPLFGAISIFYENILRATRTHLAIVWNSFPQLLFFFASLACVKKNHFYLFCAIPFFIRLGIIWLLAPLSTVLYLGDFYLCGLILILLWFSEKTKTTKQ